MCVARWHYTSSRCYDVPRVACELIKRSFIARSLHREKSVFTSFLDNKSVVCSLNCCIMLMLLFFTVRLLRMSVTINDSYLIFSVYISEHEHIITVKHFAVGKKTVYSV